MERKLGRQCMAYKFQQNIYCTQKILLTKKNSLQGKENMLLSQLVKNYQMDTMSILTQ